MSKTAPSDAAAEKAVLGSVLLDPACYDAIGPTLEADDFYYAGHQAIWSAYETLAAAGKPLEMILVADVLDAMGALDGLAGGRGYLVALGAAVPTSIHAPHYAAVVRQHAQRRRLMQHAHTLLQRADDPAVPLEETLGAAMDAVMDLTAVRGGSGWTHMGDSIAAYMETLDDLIENGRLPGLPSGFVDLDKMLGGFRKGHLIVLGGRPAMGKTAMALNVMAHVAKQGRRVAMFSLEMGEEELVLRLLCAEGKLDGTRLSQGYVTSEEMARLVRAAAALSAYDISIRDDAVQTVGAMRAALTQLSRQSSVDLVIVDYLQIVAGAGGSPLEEVSRISRDLKALAKDLDLPVLALAQLSRLCEQRTDKRPILSDIRSSGQVEQDADVVMFLYRDVVYNPETPTPDLAELIVAKHRNGPIGTVNLYFDGPATRFASAAPVALNPPLPPLDQQMAWANLSA